MKYIRKFESAAAMAAAINSLPRPFVAWDGATSTTNLEFGEETNTTPEPSTVDYSEPFYINVRGAVTLAATSGLQMSTDCETWTDTAAMTLSSGKTYFRVATDQESPLKPNWTENSNSDYDIGGNINSLVTVNFENDTNCYSFYISNAGFFQNKTKLKSAGDLILPATTLAYQCYTSMFNVCTSLTTAPALPATTLADYCYSAMFRRCTSLTTIPAILPATTVTEGCYNDMFLDCTSLTTAPALPATTVANTCYREMFKGCTSLITAPALPATTSAVGCYYAMFYGCTSLTTAPATLPATTLAESCYGNMFYNCTSLTAAPALPATTVAQKCYEYMFYLCTSLTTAPTILPATTLVDYCYRYMFYYCTSLTTAPELPATRLPQYCYASMFENCSNLNYIKCLANGEYWGYYCRNNWLKGVAATGTFVKDPSVSESDSTIPSGWTVEDAA